MTIILDLAPEDEAQLNDIAAHQGQNADIVAHNLFTAALAGYRSPTASRTHPATESQPAREWSAEFRAKYNIPPDAHPLGDEDFHILTPEEEDEAICLALDDSFAGRITPLAEWSAKVRARHNLPQGIAPMTHEEAMQVP